jgi:uncharacterized protein YcbK (DUF882 family)
MLATADRPSRLALNTSFDVGSQVPLKTARRSNSHHRSLRLGGCASLAALLILVGSQSLQNATANGDTRSLSFRNTHTNEKLTITYKVNGRYDDEALKKLNHVLRDWREDQATSMDPHLLDLVWDVYREVEATEPIAIVCGYRSPGTNAMLRRRSSGVAKFSQHMLGKAMDFYIPGVPLEKLREAGLRASRGGVGFYPSSNFVHLDTGSVRHWPRMPEAELAKVMAKGPITAIASRKTDTKVASARFPNPFAKLFGGGEEEEDAETLAATAPAARTAEAKKPAAKANDPKINNPKANDPKAKEKSAERPAVAAAAPATAVPAARPAQQGSFDLASASSRPVEPRPARAAGLVSGNASANSVISERGFWPTSPDNSAQQSAATQSTAASGTARIASADSASTGSTPWPAPDRAGTNGALAYAPAANPTSPARPTTANTQAASTPSARTAQAAPTQRDTTVAVKRGAAPQAATPPAPASTTAQTLAAALAQAKAGQQFNDPWMRAMIVAPSAGAYMSTSLLGTTDFRTLSPYLQKPSSSVMMTFANDPHLGMSTQRFAGTAVVFVSTVTFSRRTASLR